jgi:hypothetical protein
MAYYTSNTMKYLDNYEMLNDEVKIYYSSLGYYYTSSKDFTF